MGIAEILIVLILIALALGALYGLARLIAWAIRR